MEQSLKLFNMAASMEGNVFCEDFQQFQEALKSMRVIDDKIIYALNTTVPTQSFKGQVNAAETCKDLYSQLENAYSQREGAIKKCISEVSERVNRLRDERSKDPDNRTVNKNLRQEQAKLQLMRSEINIEEIVKDRSFKVFHERCRNHFISPSSSS